MNLDYSAVVAVTGVILAIYFGLRKAPHEQGAINAKAALDYATAAEKAAQRAEDAETKLSTKETYWQARFDSMQCRITTLEKDQADDRSTIADWQQGIRRLVAQFESLNIIPVWKPESGDRRKEPRKPL
jgi:chaperonin cofactor prefoldin